MLIMGVSKSGLVGLDLNWNTEVTKHKTIPKVSNLPLFLAVGVFPPPPAPSWSNVHGSEEFLLSGKTAGQ